MVLRGPNGERWVAVLALVLGACIADDDRPTQIHVTPTVSNSELATVDLESYEVTGDDRGAELCGLAAALPVSDVCSLVCDPDQFAARLLEGGIHTGACYQLHCVLSPAVSVSVGVCLP